MTRAAERLGVEITTDAAHGLARRSRGTPRVVNRLLRRARDFADVEGTGKIDEAVVDTTNISIQATTGSGTIAIQATPNTSEKGVWDTGR